MQGFPVTNPDKFWASLKTSTSNALKRGKCEDPWNWTIKGLIRIPGIGPQSIAEIAAAIQKHCL